MGIMTKAAVIQAFWASFGLTAYEENAVPTDAGVGSTEIHAQRFGTGNSSVKVFNENVIVAAGVHFGEGNGLPPGTHVVDIHQLGIIGTETALQNFG